MNDVHFGRAIEPAQFLFTLSTALKQIHSRLRGHRRDVTTMSSKIGFIGVGIMGKPMAKNLIKAGHVLTVYDVLEEPVKELEKLCAAVAQSSKEVTEKSDLIITMLPDSPDIERAAFGSKGIFEGVKPRSTYIDVSTISPLTSFA